VPYTNVDQWDIVPGDVVSSVNNETIADYEAPCGRIDDWRLHRGTGVCKRIAEIQTKRTVERFFQIKWLEGTTVWHRFGDLRRVTSRAGTKE
jgi:hypothetical protein